MQTAAISPNPVAPPPSAQPRNAAAPRDDAFGAALKAADQERVYTRQAAAAKDKSVADNDSGAPADLQATNPLDPQWLANFAAMIGHLQPLQPQPAQPVIDASVAAREGVDGETAALTGIVADPADASEDALSADDNDVLAQLGDAASSLRGKRSAGITAAPETATAAPLKAAASDLSARTNSSQGDVEPARGEAPQPAQAVAAAALAAKSAEPVVEAAASTTAVDTSAVSEVSAPTTPHGHLHSTQAALARTETPTIPGAATSLHGQALQGRLDEALRWMAGNGVQTAQIQITPDELGPITVQVQLQGDTANVLFSSAHEQTRQVLESSLGGLRDALAAGGLSLGQASVGSEQQQRNMFAETGSGERRQADSDTAFAIADGAASAQPAATPQRVAGATAATRQGVGLVNLYA